LEYSEFSNQKTWTPVSTPLTPEANNRFSVVVNGLTAGTKYYFRVQPENRFGEGPLSAPGLGLTIGAPEQPSKPAISRVTPTTMQIKWMAPNVIGVPTGKPLTLEDPIEYTLEHDDSTKG
jgi:hypothetical protein